MRIDGTRRPQAVEHALNEPVGFGLHGLAAGPFSRAATVEGGLARAPEARSWRVLCSRSAAPVRVTSAVAEGV